MQASLLTPTRSTPSEITSPKATESSNAVVSADRVSSNRVSSGGAGSSHTAASPAAHEPAEGQALRDRIAAAIDPVLKKRAYASVSVAVQWRSSRAALARGYSDLENASLARVDTVYAVGSITKQFTAAAVLQLVSRGLLQLDAPLAQYIADLPEAWQRVRVRQLLNHTSGIPNYTEVKRQWDALRPFEVAPSRLLELVSSQPLAFEPGTNFLYSNSGYVLLGLLIEAVTQMPYDTYLRKRVLQPAQLDQTFPCPARRLVPHRARGYAVEEGVVVHARYFASSNAFAAGDLCSTATGLLDWQHALWSGKILDASALRSMTEQAVLPNAGSTRYGFGIQVGQRDGQTVFFHPGRVSGYTSQLSRYPAADLTVAILTNTEHTLARELEYAIAVQLIGLRPLPWDLGFE